MGKRSSRGRACIKGQRFELAAGYAEITFDSGARAVLEGAASLEINSAWDATLRHGTLKVSVPAEAVGFRVSNPAVEVVDLGTDFTLIAAEDGAADVLVLRGEVEASPRRGYDPEVILLRENESRRFDPSGVSVVPNSAQKFARFSEPVELERFTRVVKSAHWSFDELAGDRAPANSRMASAALLTARIHNEGTDEGGAVRPEGRRGRALRFDGRVYAEAVFPGISGSHHTVAFWARVAKDAPLADAYSMVAWIPQSPKLGHRPVGINWNRDPAEGPVGALRTDFAGGCAMGTTSLRDGNWHHLTVCFDAGDDQDGSPVQVKQYVDGRLESSGIIPGQTRGPASAGNPALLDRVWLGCRLKVNGPQSQRFRGDVDELFIADRFLGPGEIVHLMRANEIPTADLAQNQPSP